MNALTPIAEVTMQAARAVLPEAVSIGAATLLPRGADPFIGTERPLLLGATRWAVASPGGVLLGGSPAAMAAVLGFEVPERPAPVAPEDRKPGTPDPPKWGDLVSEAARAAITSFSHAVSSAVVELADLPPDCAATQVSLNDNDAAVRIEVGPLPDAVVLLLHAEEHDVRLVVVIPGIFVARADRGPADTEVVQEGGAALAKPAPALPGASIHRGLLDRSLAHVPLDLSVEMGRARVPLAHVLHLQEGEVLELQQTIDAPVALVSDDTPVARGDLEVSDDGTLVLLVTSIPGRPPAKPEPRVVAEPEAEPDAEPELDAEPEPDAEPDPGLEAEPEPEPASAAEAPTGDVAEPAEPAVAVDETPSGPANTADTADEPAEPGE